MKGVLIWARVKQKGNGCGGGGLSLWGEDDIETRDGKNWSLNGQGALSQ